MNTVIARAIKDGKTLTIKSTDGKKNIPVTATTALSKEQKMQIFQSVYQDYVQPTEDGRFAITNKKGDFKQKGTVGTKGGQPAQSKQSSSGSLY